MVPVSPVLQFVNTLTEARLSGTSKGQTVRALAFLHALVKMVGLGQFYVCEPVWTWAPDDGIEPTVPSVACGKHEDIIDPKYVSMGYADRMTWYELICTAEGCRP